MGAEHPIRRNTTARELAKRMGTTPRTICRIIAEPRKEYLARAAWRRQRILELRHQGCTLAAIAAEVGMTTGSVSGTLSRLRKAGTELPPKHHQGTHKQPVQDHDQNG